MAVTPDAAALAVTTHATRGAEVAVRVGEPASPRLTYRPELDGLRAVAVGLVLATHAGIADNMGQVGVTAFFVLSGYLITSLLIVERYEVGRVDLAAFYLRRIRRLAPAFLAMLGVVCVLGVLGAWPDRWAEGVAWAATYFGNFAAAGGFPWNTPAIHTWSLNIEEQFYLVWPLLLLAMPRRPVIVVMLVAVAWSIAIRFPAPPTVLEHGTVARMDGLVAGCLTAMLGSRFPRWSAGFALAVLFAVGLSDQLAWDITAATIATVILVRSRVSGLDRLAWMGRRSYGLYLWSWPMTLLLGPAVGLVATFAAAELSYRLIEQRFRQPRRSLGDTVDPDRPRSDVPAVHQEPNRVDRGRALV